MDFKLVAQQLRKPEGDFGKQVGEKMSVSNRLLYEQTLLHMDIQKNDEVLEIGMGNGSFCHAIFSGYPSIQYTGLDYSSTMIDEANRLNAALIDSNKAKFVWGNADHMPFPENSFDKIFSINTIYFWDHPVQTLKEIYRVTKPGGSVLISLRTEESMVKMPFVRYGFKTYTEQKLRHLFSETSFEIRDIFVYREPDQEIDGNVVNVESMIVSLRKGV